VHDDGVAVADELELRAVGVLAGGVVGEGLVECDAVELPVEVLVQAAQGVADPLPGDRRPLARKCQVGIYEPDGQVSINADQGPIWTSRRGVV